jgi:hypothetical protein
LLAMAPGRRRRPVLPASAAVDRSPALEAVEVGSGA